jgi:hypothetical protein
MSDKRHIPAPNGRTATHRIGAETPGQWRRVSTHQVMHDGTVLLAFGVQVSDTQRWVGKAHAVGPTIDNKAECFANAGLFAASKDMAILLMEAAQLWAEEFESDSEISGADLVAWFAAWRQRVKPILNLAVTP